MDLVVKPISACKRLRFVPTVNVLTLKSSIEQLLVMMHSKETNIESWT